MALVIRKEVAPLHTDADGVVRVGRTRVTLDTIVAAFGEGATPEEIAQQYPSITLADIYAVIGYYLLHRTDVDEYIELRLKSAESVRQESRSRLNPSDIREHLMSRKRS